MAAPAAFGFPADGQGARGADARQAALRPRAVAGADQGRSVTAWAESRRAAGPTASRSDDRRGAARILSRAGAACAQGRRGVPQPELEHGSGVPTPRAPRRSLLRHERRQAPLRPARDGALRLRAAARSGHTIALCGILLGRRPSVVERSDSRVGCAGAGRLRVLRTTTAKAMP